jgi:hypothetical protein
MGGYSEIFWGIASAFVAFLLGLVWDRLTQFVVNFRARKFWGSLISEDLSLVLGRFRDLPGFEASGVVGVGDNIALKTLADYFTGIGFKNFTTYYNDQLSGDTSTREPSLKGNLILIGGPDANRLTREVLRRVALGVEFVEVTQAYLDGARGRILAAPQLQNGSRPSVAAPLEGRPISAHQRRHGWLAWRFPEWPNQLRGGRSTPEQRWLVPVFLDKHTRRLHGPRTRVGDLSSDCGVFIRCPNPFNPQREVMIFCGSYGYGTWAAVQYAQSKEFLANLPKKVRFLECLLEVDVVHETPQNIRVAILRPLENDVLAATESVSGSRLVG